MSKKQEGKDIKSSYELALERMQAEGGEQISLTKKQKAEIADVEQDVQAKIAETDIMIKQHIMEAQGEGDVEKMQTLEEERIVKIKKIRAEGEERRQRIRESRD